MKNKEFNRLVRKYFNLFIKRFPEYGSFLGLHKYDGKWSDQHKEKYLGDIEFFKEYLKRFKKLDEKKLTDKEKLDRKIVIHDLKLTIFYYEQLRFWESDPDILDGIGSTLFLLLNRETTSPQKRVVALSDALEDLSKLFEQIKTRLARPYKLWVKIAIESCDGLQFFLENLKPLKTKKTLKKKLLGNIRISIKSVKDYKEFLKKEILPDSIDKYIIGKKHFEELIKLRELNLTTNEMLKIGEDALRANKEELKEIAKEINPTLAVKQVTRRIKNNHPRDFNHVIKEYKKVVIQSRKFIIQNNLMKFPDDEKVLIRKTPRFLRHTTPFAAYFAPAKFEKRKIGIYIVTPPRNKSMLKKHSYADIHNTSVHEAYPGHHLQSVLGFKNVSLIRALSDATEFVEGWAHYCEEYMREVGFNNKNEIRFIQALDEIWRAARIIIDVKLHSGKMTFREAVKLLIKEVDMDEKNAVAEVKRYTKNPSYQLSYLIGKYLIKELKRNIEEKMGERYSDRFFHHVILNAGAIPIKYLREEFYLKIRKI